MDTLFGIPTGAIGQRVLQCQRYETGALVASAYTTTPWDNTTPQTSETSLFFSLTVTPKITGSKLLIEVIANVVGGSGLEELLVCLFATASTNCLICANVGKYASGGNTMPDQAKLSYQMTTTSTNPLTFQVRGGQRIGYGIALNGSSGSAAIFNSTLISSITVLEVAQA